MTIYQELSMLFVNIYNGHKEKGVTHIPSTTVAEMVMIDLYNQFVKDGTIKPIEDLELSEKESLVNECREMQEDYTNETLTTQCRILHVIKQINNYS